jgi:hypothetical protein
VTEVRPWGDSPGPAPNHPETGTAFMDKSEKPPWRYRFGVVIGLTAAVLLLAICVGAYFAVHASTKPEPFALTGTLALNSGTIRTSGLPMGYSCAGDGDYNDLGPGTTVTVHDETGKLLAKGSIESSSSQSGSCMLNFTVYNIPDGGTLYKVEVSHRGQMSYTEAEAKAGINIQFGNSASSTPTAPPPPPPPASAPVPPPTGPVPADPPREVPSYSTRCPTTFFSTEFHTSAVGSSVTSCAFAEQVRYQYLDQWRRGVPVAIWAHSPVVRKDFLMSCSGGDMVTCTGGNDAVVYLY